VGEGEGASDGLGVGMYWRGAGADWGMVVSF